MDWSAEGATWLAIGALCVAVVLLIALIVLAARHRRLRLQLAAPGAAGPSGTADMLPAAIMRTPIDRVLPRHPAVFYPLALVISAACWGLGLALAPSVPRFLQSREWHIQPFYLAAHLIALRLFVQLFVRKFVAGAAHLDIPAERVADGVRRVLGLQGWLAAVVIAVPFCVLDYRYLVSDRYEKLGEDQLLHAIDYAMWGIWCAEWLLNAFIWVTLAGFLAMGYRALRTCRFRAPIATVVQEKLYRPFLQMSSQGATIVLGFACVTAFYIWYAGGSAADFLGLAVTGVLLVVGFVPSWLLLNAKVKRTVREEIEALRRNLPAPREGARCRRRSGRAAYGGGAARRGGGAAARLAPGASAARSGAHRGAGAGRPACGSRRHGRLAALQQPAEHPRQGRRGDRLDPLGDREALHIAEPLGSDAAAGLVLQARPLAECG
jgi:hypothetical protein